MAEVPVRGSSADLESVTFSLCRTADEFPSLFAELEELLDRATVRNPYFFPEWIDAWWKRRDSREKPLIVLARNGEGRLEGFWPFVERPAILWSKGLWPMVYDEANYFVPIATELGMESLCFGIKEQLKEFVPYVNQGDPRFPIYGGLLHKRGGTARHDAVAWGYARAADRLGVDIIQNCEVTGMVISNGTITGVETNKGIIKADKVGMAVAGRTSQVASMAGLKLPIESHVLQAFVSEGLKPCINCEISWGAELFYISQSGKGGLVFGGDIDKYNTYAARGNLPAVENVMEAAMALMPMIGKAKVLRSWGGIVDMTMDGSPIIDKTPITGLYLDGGWCYGGFKATPASGWCFAHLLATDIRHDVAKKFRLDRFEKGYLLDEEATGATPNLH